MVETRRLELTWRTELQWVDYHGKGHKAKLLHEVVSVMLKQTDSIRAVLRKNQAKAGAEIRMSKRVEGIPAVFQEN